MPNLNSMHIRNILVLCFLFTIMNQFDARDVQVMWCAGLLRTAKLPVYTTVYISDLAY